MYARKVENLKSFIVSFVPMTNESAERISIKDVLRNKKKVIDYSNDIEDAFYLQHAIYYLECKGYTVVGTSDIGDKFVVLTKFDFGDFDIFNSKEV